MTGPLFGNRLTSVMETQVIKKLVFDNPTYNLNLSNLKGLNKK